MTKMNPEIKARWVAALRSGEYAQTQQTLRQGEAFCCLGVLCDLYDKEGWGKDFHEAQGTPPEAVLEWAAFPEARWTSRWRVIPSVRINGQLGGLPMHNDKGRTFAEIADAIEQQL